MLWLVSISIAIIAVILSVIFLQAKSMRKADVVSAVANCIFKCKIPQALDAVGLLKRPSINEVTASNGAKTLFHGPLFCTTEEVLDLKIRESDVFVATSPKAGTTWMQEIAWLICNNVDIQTAKKNPVALRSPFLEVVALPAGGIGGLQSIETWAEDKPRIIKTHLPYELLPREIHLGAKCKIIYVARNPKDVCVSRYHFHRSYKHTSEPGTWNEFFTKFSTGKLAWGSWFDHNLKYWEKYQSDKERIYFVTYETLKMNFRREISSISRFLNKTLTDQQLDAIVQHCTFASMGKNNMTNYSIIPAGKTGFSKFMRKGMVGDWKNHFTINQNAMFDELYNEKMKGSGLDFQFN